MAFIKQLLMCLSVINLVTASAIPMWEMLSREEKMAYLYTQFLNQVENYCEFSEMENCNKELIKHGLSKLHSMPDDHLDLMDPYQRGAHNIIWDSMMDGHAVMAKNQKTKTAIITTQKPTKVVSPSIYNILPKHSPPSQNFGHSTTKISSIQDQIDALESKSDKDINNYNYISNDDQFNDNNLLSSAASLRTGETIAGVGPMVVRVKPDGTLVDRQLPIDEDLYHYKLAKTRIPPKHMVDRFVEDSYNIKPSFKQFKTSQPYAVYVRP